MQSTTACPGGSGVSAVPNADLYDLNLTKVYSLNASLSGELNSATLTNACLTGATLTGAA